MSRFKFAEQEFEVAVTRTDTMHGLKNVHAVATPISNSEDSPFTPLELRGITCDDDADEEVTWVGVWSDESNLPLATAFAAHLLEICELTAVKFAAETTAFNVEVWFRLIQTRPNLFVFNNKNQVVLRDALAKKTV